MTTLNIPDNLMQNYNTMTLIRHSLTYTLGLLMVYSLPATAELLKHSTQTEVLTYLDNYQTELKVVSAQRTLSFAALLTELEDKRVIFVGEQHDRYDHHLNQLTILRALHQQNPNLAIGLEWFQQPFQNVLDDYLAGQITEAELLQQSEYYERWRYDYRLLRPIMEYAKTNRVPVLALNAPREMTAKVSEQGLEGLNQDERAQIPDTIHPPPAEYREYLEGVFKQHMRGQGDVTRFILVQRIWDETMAMNVVNYLQDNPQQRMVVFAGSGHLISAAIPNDVARSIPAAQLISIHSAERDKIEPEQFDYFVISEEKKLPPTGKLGVWLDDQPGQVGVLKLAEESAAGKAGLQKGDRIISVNAENIDSMAQLLSLLSRTQPGDEVEVQIERDEETLKYVFTLQ